MPRKSTEPLHKITIDLFCADFVWLQANSLPLTETIREAVREKVIMLKAQKHRMTLGDLGECNFHHEKDGTKVYHSDKDYRND